MEAVLHQGAKWRAIDDGRASRANSGAGFTAQVRTATVDGVVANVRTFYRRVLQHFGTELPDDQAMEGGVDDETAAFRYRPTRDDDAPFLIVAVFNPVLRRVQFGEMNGHPFGVGAAVLNYNRQPEVVIHTMRKVLGVSAHLFYDDALILNRQRGKGLSTAVLPCPPRPLAYQAGQRQATAHVAGFRLHRCPESVRRALPVRQDRLSPQDRQSGSHLARHCALSTC